jgi:hypothetical protein
MGPTDPVGRSKQVAGRMLQNYLEQWGGGNCGLREGLGQLKLTRVIESAPRRTKSDD